MLEYWMAINDTETNESVFELDEVLEDPGSAALFDGYPPWLLYFAAGCCLLFMLIGIPGNLITVAALFRTKKLRNATAVFIMNLSISDLMFCCFNLPLATSTFWHSSWQHGALLCRLFPLLRYGLLAVSLFTVLAITINRYVMIGHPRLYPKLYKPRYLILMVLATWISGFGALVATWFEHWGRFGLDPVIGSCTIVPDVNGRSPKEFLFILAFLTPCIAIVVCYARIFYIVRKTAQKSRRREKATTNLVKASLEVKFTKNYEDSALGSSCGPTATTTTENGGSPTKTDRSNAHYIITPQSILLPEKIPIPSSPPLEKINERNENTSPVDPKCCPRNDPSSTSTNSNSSSNSPRTIQDPFPESLKENGTAHSPASRIYPVIPNFSISDVDKTEEKSEEQQILRSKMLGSDSQCLKVPNRFQKDEASSEGLSRPQSSSSRYEPSEISEEFPSSRSDSPSEKRQKKNSLFRRESRFRSIKNRGLESGKMTAKDKKLLKMILVIFSSFLICYLPITISKTFKDVIDWRGLNIAGYILIYLTTCINPVIYVVMSSEYRSAYKNVLLCRSDSFEGKKRAN
ncbi:G-protein coupled receptor moody [Fopius arisanus]|uniref:G-protein coupled receptor moody n=2 Tax=Fopius arisanus TaxID=64838 RepID=A0A9R1U484_9HYME|nr:PREDICTED: G-protein coupled receptor moody [Fopius arisanus]XP_011306893.1 PREDICTED: G-protein coupled receptor moody [Fopius arisanus]XP_011306894.1 PREDICTED: G-protein coupled receptor moody [Fopius arisanus]